MHGIKNRPIPKKSVKARPDEYSNWTSPAAAILHGWLKPGELELRAGEMTAQEKRTITAVLISIRDEIERLPRSD